MTEYYDLVFELRIPGKWYLNDVLGPDGREILSVTFTQGLPIEPMPDLTIMPNVVGTPVDFTFTTFAVPVVSTAFADFVEKFDAGAIQRIPVTIAPDIAGFEILNVVRLVDCFDYEKSEFQIFGKFDPEDLRGKITAVSGLRIIPEHIGDYHIFRLGEWNLAIIVSGTLKDALEGEGFTGMRFIPV